MPEPARPPFRADHVGSFLRPPRLRAAMERHDPEVRAIQDEAIRGIVAMQEEVGLAVATDGEFRHESWQHFLESLSGVSVVRPAPKPGAPPGSFEPRSYRIDGRLAHPRPVEVESFKFLASICHTTPKQTLASPSLLLRAGREGIDPAAYPDLDGFKADVAAAFRAEVAALGQAGCRYLQLDDTNFAYLCDPEFKSRRFGSEPAERIAATYVTLINQSLAARPAGMATAVHICRGNSAGNFAAQGGYEPVAEVLFGGLDVDGYFLEYDDARSGGFEPLRFLPKGSRKRFVLGLVSTKRPELESKDLLKRRIEEAAKVVPLDNLCLGPQCGFASAFRGNPVSEDIQRRKLDLVVETAREVWGTAH